MRIPDWTKFRRQIYINASKADLYNRWTSRKGMESWFLRSAIYYDANGEERKEDELCQTGDTYLWKWHNWDGQHKGKVLQANGRDKVVFDFEDANVTVDIYEGRGMTCVDLVQSDIATDEVTKYKVYHGSSCGWTFWLTNLKAVCEHGISLNDTSPGLLDEHRDMDVVNI